MTREELIKAYVEAYNQVFIGDITNCECNSECEDCPAGAACDQLAYNPITDTADYPTFLRNWAVIEDEVREAIDEQ